MPILLIKEWILKYNIRVVLLTLTLLFISTAYTIRKSISDSQILDLDTDYLKQNIAEQENLVDEIFTDTLLLKTFEHSERYPLQLRSIANDYVDRNIYLYIYKNNKPIFWSTNTYVPKSPAIIKDCSTFLQNENYSFIGRKKSIKDDIEVVALISLEQKDLQNHQASRKQFNSYLDAQNIEIADFKESKNIRNIYAKDSKLLFSVTLKAGQHNNIYTQLQLACWIIASLCFIAFITIWCYYLATREKPILSIIILAIILYLLRIIDLEFNGLSTLSNQKIFLSSYYSFNYYTPNLWAFLMNSISIFWVISYTVYIKKYILVPKQLKQPVVAAIIYYLLISFIYIFFIFIFNQLATLITHSSNYQKDLAQFLYNGDFTLTHVLIYSISILSVILLTDFILDYVKHFNLKRLTTVNLQLIVLIQFIIIDALNDHFTIVIILIAILIAIRPYDKIIFNQDNKSIHIVTLITIALITNIKLSEASKEAMIEQMKLNISELQAEDDIQAINQFSKIEKEIVEDHQLKTLFQLAKTNNSEDIITEYIRKKYLSGYISKYDFTGYYYNNDSPLGHYNSDIINSFREKVIGQSIKVDETDLFYKSQATGIGVYEYFSILKIQVSTNDIATIILDFTNKNSNELIYTLTGEQNFLTAFIPPNDNSFAVYRNGALNSQNGKYIYPNKDNHLPKGSNTFINYESHDGYYHVIYRDSDETIVVSKADQAYWQFVAIASVIFLLLYSLTLLIKILTHIVPRYFHKDFKLRYLNYEIRDLLNTIRYSTRIQTLVISSVVIVILISGLITFYSVRIQNKQTRDDGRLNFITEIAGKLELKLLTDNSDNPIDYLSKSIFGLTDIVVADFNLYDNTGKLFYTSQPKIYEKNLMSNYINPNALIDINVLKKLESSENESIVDFEYESIYAPIKNSNYHTIAYLNIPYYNSQEIDAMSRDTLLNTIFNIYTIIIIIFAFLSIYIANKITEPLHLIRKKLTTTNFDEDANEPLYWEKNDEIGLLIKDYNYMLVKLEENAKQLRNAEREIAWREMAKQVAHEIKNPLTPMKLGIQQLTRCFKENDPRLPERFDKISHSFIEQIDALAHIANEFSNFAKLPDTNLTPIDPMLTILQSIEVYQHSTDTTIEFTNNTKKHHLAILGDHDQVLRSFNNLIKNAIEATTTRRKHRITIEAHIIDNDWLKIAVHDNGDGIPKELRSNIFKPNFTTKTSGTGLGLAFVKQTIDNMGGRIYYETKLNWGTTFFIEIPLYKSKK